MREPLGEEWIVHQFPDRLGEWARLARRDQNSGHSVRDGFIRPRDCRRDHRLAGSHCLQHGKRQSLIKRRQHEHVAAGEQIGNILAISEKVDPVRDIQALRLFFQHRPVGSITCQDEPRFRQPRRRLQ